MGSESTIPPPNLMDEKPQPNPEHVKPVTDEILGDNAREASPPSVFVNSEPIREDQVQNAVKFLSHPKVRGSPVMYRRSFLEKKGLTRDEIDEAFRRVPDPAPTVTTTPAINQNQDGQMQSATNIQQQGSTPATQPVAASPTGVVSTMTALRPAKFSWSHALLAIGFFAASGAGTALLFKKAIVPRLKVWIRKVVLEEETDTVKELDSKPSLVEEAAAAATAAAAAASEVAKASQQMLNSKVEERRYFESLKNLLDVQVEEMKSMNKAIRKLEVTKEVTISSTKQTEEFKSPPMNVTSFPAPASTESSAAPHPKSYMEIMAMVQRGEKPPGIKEINDLPPNPNQPPSNPRLAPRTKPWETTTTTTQNGSYPTEGYQANGDNSTPWWQQKSAKISEIYEENQVKGTPERRAWVPPQAPPIAMPEAAAAIRQQKQIVQVEQSNNGGDNSDDFDELQRITKISESGGEVSRVERVSEIQEEQDVIVE